MRKKWTKEFVIHELQKQYYSGEKINCYYLRTHCDACRRLYSAAERLYGSLEIAVEEAGIAYDNVLVQAHRSLTLPEMITKVLDLYQNGNLLYGRVVQKENRSLYYASSKHLGKGGWRKLLILAGLDSTLASSRTKWTKEAVQKQILSFHKSGIPLTQTFLKRQYPGFLTGACSRFGGSWKAAVESCGLDYYRDVGAKKKFKWWNKGRVIEEIKATGKEGIRLSSRYVQYLRIDLFDAAVKHCGSWGAAVEMAGFDYNRHRLQWSSKAWMRSINKDRRRQIEEAVIRFAERRRQWKQTKISR